MLATAGVFLFERYRLDRRGLFRRDESGAIVPIPIGSRALETLRVLVDRSGDLVSRNDIMNVVWAGTAVESSNLPVQIAALRRLLDNGEANVSYIQTVSGRGYRFIPPVTRVNADANSAIQAISQGGELPRPRLSIVVLPFTNLSDDQGQQYFADGITDDLTTDLSRIADMFVISRNTAFTYRDKPVDTKRIGHELRVRYVLDGSVRRSGNQVRVNAQLIDAETDAHLWAERFDHDIGDLFALQNEVTGRIAIALNLELARREAARPTENPDELDYILRGRAAFSKPRTRDSQAEIIGLFECALLLDPQSVEAQSALALALTGRVLEMRMSGTAAADLARAEGLVEQALATSPHNPSAHYTKGQVLRAYGRPEEAILEYETAIALNRNGVFAYAGLGACKIATGSIEEAIPLIERAIRLSPRDPYLAFWYFSIGRAHLLQSRVDEAILWFEKARSANSGLAYVRACLASAYALKAETERAAAELAEARRLSSDDRYSSIARLSAVGYWGVPKVRALYETIYFAGLRKAGMAEE